MEDTVIDLAACHPEQTRSSTIITNADLFFMFSLRLLPLFSSPLFSLSPSLSIRSISSLSPLPPQGTVYHKTNAEIEMKKINREEFWEQAKVHDGTRRPLTPLGDGRREGGTGERGGGGGGGERERGESGRGGGRG